MAPTSSILEKEKISIEAESYLEFVTSLIVVQVPATATDNHHDLLLCQGGQSSVQQNFQFSWNCVTPLQYGSGHLVHCSTTGRSAGLVRSRSTGLMQVLALVNTLILLLTLTKTEVTEG